MVQLTVGYVAGFVAAGIFVAGLWSPNVLAFIVSATLRDTNSAATWTAASRVLQSSYWPEVLRADPAQSHGVRKDILLLTTGITIMGALVSIAGVVTPLGLYEALVTSNEQEAPFRYVKDLSPFGLGTPKRSNYTFNRICLDKFGLYAAPCPFSDSVFSLTFVNDTPVLDYPYGYDINLPKNITDAYSSGTKGHTTISNFFDIQWRRYLVTKSSGVEGLNNGSAYVTSEFREIQTLALNKAIEPVEGLIVDTISGGIGFRNHTVPPGFQHGVTWEEDLLFIEPETICVDTNLTVDFKIGQEANAYAAVSEVWLTDRGGFVDLDHSHPAPDLSNPQGNANVFGRAYRAAWMNNFYTMLYLNVTDDTNSTRGTKAFSYLNSTVGKKFPLPLPSNSDLSSNMLSLKVSTTFGDYLNLGSDIETRANGSNPFKLTEKNFTAAYKQCIGTSDKDFANISNIYISCGMMHGAPQRFDGGDKLIYEAGSLWSQPLYSCASALKAVIKTASFNYNGTQGLASLRVDRVVDKKYPNETSMPLWGVENTGNNYTMAQMNAIWGLVDSSYENHPNVSTVRQGHLYLPGTSALSIVPTSGIQAMGRENLPGTDFFSDAIENAYTIPSNSLASATDYSGQVSMAMLAYWQTLSRSAETASLITNLVFADTAASAVVGTKGVLGPGNTEASPIMPILVTPTVLKIRYQWPFAIPAFIVMAAILVTTIVAVGTLILKRHNFDDMRRRINFLSPGRIYTAMLYPQQDGTASTSHKWSKQMGKKMVDLGGVYGVKDDIPGQPETQESATGGEHAASEAYGVESEDYLLTAVKHEPGRL